MNNNLEIWNKVKITNPRDTKDLQQGRKITTIDAYTQIQNATEQFGPMGKGWGLLDLTHNTLPALQDGSIVVVSSANFFI